jgi:hypothetical protein
MRFWIGGRLGGRRERLARHGKAKPPTVSERGGRYRRPDVKAVHFLRLISFTPDVIGVDLLRSILFTPPRCEGNPPSAVVVAYPFHLALIVLLYRPVAGGLNGNL